MKQLEFASHPGNLSLVRKFIRSFLENVQLTSMENDLIVLGVDEACTNIIRHVYKDEATRLISLSCERIDTGIRIRLRDFGEHGNVHEMQGRPLDVVEPGGLGLHLIRRAFDEVNYRLKQQGTELILTKHLAGLDDASAEKRKHSPAKKPVKKSSGH